jgi:hypothetical protein
LKKISKKRHVAADKSHRAQRSRIKREYNRQSSFEDIDMNTLTLNKQSKQLTSNLLDKVSLIQGYSSHLLHLTKKISRKRREKRPRKNSKYRKKIRQERR